MLITNVKDFTYGSKQLVEICCDYCTASYHKMYRNYLIHNDKSIISKDSCNNCKLFKNIEIQLKKHEINTDINYIITFLMNKNQKKISCVYQIKNIHNNKIYIGSTTSLINRWKSHVLDLKNGTHNSKTLLDDYKIYGLSAFIWSIVQLTDDNDNELSEIEYEYIKSHNKLLLYNTFLKKKNYSPKNIHSVETRDYLKKIRQGEGTSTSKFSNEDVLKIKELILSGIKLSEIASLFNVSEATISDIKNLKTWTHVIHERDSELKEFHYISIGSHNPCSKLNEQKVREIKNRLSLGEQLTSIAKDYNVTRTLIGHIKRGKLWNHVS